MTRNTVERISVGVCSPVGVRAASSSSLILVSAGVAAYCLHDRREPGQTQPRSAEWVEWTKTRNLPTSRGERAAAVTAATAEAAPELKRLTAVSARGRKLEKPVCRYSLSWAREEVPEWQEMSRAAAESLRALGLEKH